jgi:hypothetical protein
MQRYANRSGDSGVAAYEIGRGWITVEFNEGATYLYNAHEPGPAAVAEMQRLAKAGQGLSSYISRDVQTRYAKKLR